MQGLRHGTFDPSERRLKRTYTRPPMDAPAKRSDVASEEVMAEDAEVRVVKVTLPPRTSLAPGSASRNHWLCVLEGGRALASATNASAWELRYEQGQTAFMRAGDEEPRVLTNLGESSLRFLRIELKR